MVVFLQFLLKFVWTLKKMQKYKFCWGKENKWIWFPKSATVFIVGKESLPNRQRLSKQGNHYRSSKMFLTANIPSTIKHNFFTSTCLRTSLTVLLLVNFINKRKDLSWVSLLCQTNPMHKKVFMFNLWLLLYIWFDKKQMTLYKKGTAKKGNA